MSSQAQPPQPRTIFWIDVRDHRPDDEITVLIQHDGEVEQGYSDGESPTGWYTSDGLAVIVTHWCDLPAPVET